MVGKPSPPDFTLAKQCALTMHPSRCRGHELGAALIFDFVSPSLGAKLRGPKSQLLQEVHHSQHLPGDASNMEHKIGAPSPNATKEAFHEASIS